MTTSAQFGEQANLSCNYVTCPDVSWCLPPEILTLRSDEVHVWRASLEVTPSALKKLEQALVEEELLRAKPTTSIETASTLLSLVGC